MSFTYLYSIRCPYDVIKAGNIASASTAEDHPFLTDEAPYPTTPLYRYKVFEEEIQTVKRTTIISEYAETASFNKTPTQKSDDNGFSHLCRHLTTAVLPLEIKANTVTRRHPYQLSPRCFPLQ